VLYCSRCSRAARPVLRRRQAGHRPPGARRPHPPRPRPPADNRVVHLRYTDQGKATGLAFFGSLGDRAHAILDQFGSEELLVIARFITAMADSVHQQVQDTERRP
jgi:hypothetical protein